MQGPADECVQVNKIFFFGAFNPCHFGHQAAIELALQYTSCRDGLLIVPASDRPTWNKPVESFHHRVAMLKILVEHMASKYRSIVSISRIEQELLERGVTGGYTMTSLEALQCEGSNSGTDALLLGADAAAQFHRWKDFDEILKRCMLLVVPRDGLLSYQEILSRLDPVLLPFVASGQIRIASEHQQRSTAFISSTAVRNGSWTMTAAAIARYRETHQLYAR